jgi:drug/metabolite transporter (DMT)-like permease
VITFQLGSVAPEMSVGYRFLLAAIVLFGWCKWRGLSLRFALRHHIDLMLFGAGMFCISYILVYYAETFIVSGMVAVGYSASPMIAMLLSRLFFRTPMKLRVAAGSTLGIAGIVCVFWNEFGKLNESRNAELGALFTVLSVIASSLGSMVALRTQQRGFSTWTSMAWGMLYGGLMALAVGALLGRPFTFEWTVGYSLSLVYLAVLGSIVTFACYLTLMERLGAAPASYVGVMVPVVALAVSFFFEKFEWGWLTTLGVALSVAGNVAMLKGKQAA